MEVAVREICPGDLLGRRVTSSGQAKKAARALDPSVDFRVFVDAQSAISVDRLDIVPDSVLTAIADAEIPPTRDRFYGWAVVSLEVAAANGRMVKAVATTANPYHADIQLPAAALDDREQRVGLAHELSRKATWRPRSDP